MTTTDKKGGKKAKKSPAQVAADRDRANKSRFRKEAKALNDPVKIRDLIEKRKSKFPKIEQWLEDLLKDANPDGKKTHREETPTSQDDGNTNTAEPRSGGAPDFASILASGMPVAQEYTQPIDDNKANNIPTDDVPKTETSQPGSQQATPVTPAGLQGLDPTICHQYAAKFTTGAFFVVCERAMGPEWKPEPQEAEAIIAAMSAWFVADGIGDMSPRSAALVTLGTYALGRMHKPETQTRLQRLQNWMASKWFQLKNWRLRKQGNPVPQEPKKEAAQEAQAA